MGMLLTRHYKQTDTKKRGATPPIVNNDVNNDNVNNDASKSVKTRRKVTK